ncbi:MAG: nuclear transport factor 2 family protein [Myxococcales bacterium]|nr:nuclear transport factor 2 family protein [Myxococcales bacterium]
MHPNEQMIRDFYECFSKRDAAGMVKHYAPDVTFTDSAFVGLRGAEARGMWRMLCERGADLRVEYRDVSADDKTGKAHWDAYYTFSKTGRKVINRIDASFRFENGKIIEHRDSFDFWVWSRQALGLPGYLLGWGPLQGVVQKNAKKELLRYLEKHPE